MKLEQIHNSFPFLTNSPDVTYLDSGATALKLKSVVDAINDYYLKDTVSPNSLDSHLGYGLEQKIKTIRQDISSFIHCDYEEVVFTSGATQGINDAASMIQRTLKPGDEIILNKLEHGANLLPWYKIRDEAGAIIKFAEIENGGASLKGIKDLITDKTKLISVAQMSNTAGAFLELEEFTNEIKEEYPGITILVDSTQSIAHHEVNLKSLNVDFLVFSGHKIYGPTGIGILYINKGFNASPVRTGGGMNSDITNDGYSLKSRPYCFEAGTMNVAGILGLGAAINWMKNVGYSFIKNHELSLRKYAVDQLIKNVPEIDILNKDVETPLIIFNIGDVHPHDVSSTLAKKKIVVRSGLSCAKLAHQELCFGFVRISLAIYNTKEDIDYLVKILKESKDFISIF